MAILRPDGLGEDAARFLRTHYDFINSGSDDGVLSGLFHRGGISDTSMPAYMEGMSLLKPLVVRDLVIGEVGEDKQTKYGLFVPISLTITVDTAVGARTDENFLIWWSPDHGFEIVTRPHDWYLALLREHRAHR